jgi:ketosteroid isomerase-like protein
MKTSIAALLLLALTSLPVSAQKAQEPAPASPPSDEATHDALRALRDGLLDAISKGDIDRELAYFHPNTVITWNNAEVSRGRDGMREYMTRMLDGPNKAVNSFKADVKVDELTILYGGDTGVSFGSAVEHFEMSSGRTFDLPARWSATLVKEGDTWLIASLHVSDNLFDNPLLNMARQTALWAGGIALILGFVLGFILGRRRKAA